MSSEGFSRRDFIGTASAAAFGAMVVPRHVLGGPGYQAPSDTLNIAGVGVGGMGASNLQSVESENIVALCDIDFQKSEEVFNRYPKAALYRDYRVMFDEMGDQIDAVIIATPDHTHAVIANQAMKMGMHPYIQKPLTHSVHEARVLRQTAEETGVVTQMGNQGHSNDDARLVNEWIRAGVIGTVREVHVWTNRPIWPQGIEAPEQPAPLPDHISWDLFLGPAPFRQYHSAYHPFAWRGWVDYGTGAIGDMAAHLVDHPVWALELGYPSTIETNSTPFNGVSFPQAEIINFTFPQDGGDPLPLTWYDGGLKPPKPDEMADDEELPDGGGVLYIGDEGKLLHETYGTNPRLMPADLMEEAREVEQTFPRVEGSHEMNWVQACKGQGEAVCPLSYAAPLTETMLLGVVALKAGRKIEWDGEAGRITNVPDANQYLHRNYRAGWTL
jgi:predicted dehydrogenase